MYLEPNKTMVIQNPNKGDSKVIGRKMGPLHRLFYFSFRNFTFYSIFRCSNSENPMWVFISARIFYVWSI